MEKLTINSRKFGPITFSWHGYIWVDLNGKPGTLGQQICDNGHLMGNTISAYSTDDFQSKAKKWWRYYLSHRRGL